MADDEESRLAEKTERQAETLKKANPNAKVEVSNETRGDAEVNEVRISTERTS